MSVEVGEKERKEWKKARITEATRANHVCSVDWVFLND